MNLILRSKLQINFISTEYMVPRRDLELRARKDTLYVTLFRFVGYDIPRS